MPSDILLTTAIIGYLGHSCIICCDLWSDAVRDK